MIKRGITNVRFITGCCLSRLFDVNLLTVKITRHGQVITKMNVTSKLPISKAAKDWNISRQTLYKYIKSGKLSKNNDGTLSVVEMIRVFGEKKQSVNDLQPENVNYSQLNDTLHIEIISLTKQIEFLTKQIDDYKSREAWYMQQIDQLQPKRIEDKTKKSFLSRFLG